MNNTKYFSLIVGIIFLILGVYILVNPVGNMITLSVLFSIVMLLAGISEIVGYFNSNRRELWYLLNGVITVILAIWLLSADDVSKATLIPNLLALWIFCSGIARLIDGLALKKTLQRETNLTKRLVTFGITGIVLGIILWIVPGIVATLLTILIAAIFIFQGILFISTYMVIK